MRSIPGKQLLPDSFLDNVRRADGNSRELQFIERVIRGLHVYHDGAHGELIPRPFDENAGGYDARYEDHSRT
jgi:hypothetical protein